MDQRPSWEANRSSASQEIPRILWNPKVHYCIHKHPLTVPILSQISSVHDRPSHFLKTHFNIILPSTHVFQVVSFPIKIMHAPLLSPLHASARRILLDLITQRVFPRHIEFSTPLLLVTSSLLGAYIFLSTHFQTPWTYVPPSMYSTTFHALSHPHSPAKFKKWGVFQCIFWIYCVREEENTDYLCCTRTGISYSDYLRVLFCALSGDRYKLFWIFTSPFQ